MTEFKLVRTTYLSEVKHVQLMFAPLAANGLVYVPVTLSLDFFFCRNRYGPEHKCPGRQRLRLCQSGL